jgi:hypothetical protein
MAMSIFYGSALRELASAATKAFWPFQHCIQFTALADSRNPSFARLAPGKA